jgi:hypothetical protein
MAIFTNITPKKGPYELTVTPAAMATTVQTDQSFTVTGVTTDDMIHVSFPSLETGVVLSHYWVSAANTVKVRMYNPTGSTITPAAQTMKVVVL